jgi:hypothetical protein
MYLRLAFAVAAHLDRKFWWWMKSGGGGRGFQRKCLGKWATCPGRTVLFREP